MIGILDWGIGGLSVYKALRARGSTADVLYFSDSGFTPYGKLSREALRARLGEIANWFRERAVTRVLVGCHAASSALSPEAETGAEAFSGVAFYSIAPAARRVVERCVKQRVGVIGGVLTIQSGVYERALAGLGKELQFHPAQPLSAIVEAGALDLPETESEVARLLGEFNSIEALLLACTHYPALTPVFQRLAPGVELLDPGAEMAGDVEEEGASGFEFHTTGDRASSARAALSAFGVLLS